MFDCVLVNGDSYTRLGEHKVYSDFLAEDLGVPVFNVAREGSNNKRITRSTIEHLIELKKNFAKPLVVVGWSFVKRIEVWYYGDNAQVINRIPDRNQGPDHLEPRLITLNMLLNLNQATLEQKCLITEDLFVHKQLIDFYTDLYMLAHTVESMGSEFFCFSAAKNTEIPISSFPYIESMKQVQWCMNNKNIHQLHDFCIVNWAQEHDPDRHPVTGHLSEQGHKNFAVMVKDWIHLLNG